MNGWTLFLLTFGFILGSKSISEMGKESLMYVPVQKFVDMTATQPEQVHIGLTGTITYTQDDLKHIRENCKHDNRSKILGYDTCINIRNLGINRRIARGLGLKHNQHRRQETLNSRFIDMANLICQVSKIYTTIINENKVSLSIMNSQSIKNKDDQI